jgi:SAM-dependent methyltransferase
MPELIFTQGNHAMERADRVPVPTVILGDVALGHFPVRSARQMEAKAIVGWAAYLIKDPNSRNENLGYQWREAFDQVIADGGIGQELLSRWSMMYAQQRDQIDWAADAVQDPMDFQYERRYDALRSKSLLSTIAKSIEGMLATRPEGFAELIRRECRQKADQEGQTFAVERSSPTAFPASWHFENLFLDLPPFRHLIDVLRPQSVLDVGCGIGAYLLYFAHHQVKDYFGVDGIPASASLLPSDRYLQHDLSRPLDLGRQFDMVLCIEVLEHLPPDDADRLLASIANHANTWIVFSAAEPGQPGVGHINCRPVGEWIESWRQLGWQCDVLASLSFRSLANFQWLRRNPVVLRRIDGVPSKPVCAVLEEIGRKSFRWHPQAAAIHSHPLAEDLAPDLYD